MDNEKTLREVNERGERMSRCFDMDVTMTLEVPVRFVVEAESSDEARRTLRKVGNDIVKGGDFKDEREDPVVIEADGAEGEENEDERDDERYVSPEDEEERTLSGLRSLRDAALKD